jgi:hypothetical protein
LSNTELNSILSDEPAETEHQASMILLFFSFKWSFTNNYTYISTLTKRKCDRRTMRQNIRGEGWF